MNRLQSRLFIRKSGNYRINQVVSIDFFPSINKFPCEKKIIEKFDTKKQSIEWCLYENKIPFIWNIWFNTRIDSYFFKKRCEEALLFLVFYVVEENRRHQSKPRFRIEPRVANGMSIPIFSPQLIIFNWINKLIRIKINSKDKKGWRQDKIKHFMYCFEFGWVYLLMPTASNHVMQKNWK